MALEPLHDLSLVPGDGSAPRDRGRCDHARPRANGHPAARRRVLDGPPVTERHPDDGGAVPGGDEMAGVASGGRAVAQPGRHGAPVAAHQPRELCRRHAPVGGEAVAGDPLQQPDLAHRGLVRGRHRRDLGDELEQRDAACRGPRRCEALGPEVRRQDLLGCHGALGIDLAGRSGGRGRPQPAGHRRRVEDLVGG